MAKSEEEIDREFERRKEDLLIAVARADFKGAVRILSDDLATIAAEDPFNGYNALHYAAEMGIVGLLNW